MSPPPSCLSPRVPSFFLLPQRLPPSFARGGVWDRPAAAVMDGGGCRRQRLRRARPSSAASMEFALGMDGGGHGLPRQRPRAGPWRRLRSAAQPSPAPSAWGAWRARRASEPASGGAEGRVARRAGGNRGNRGPWIEETEEGGACRPDSGEGACRWRGLGWGKGGGGRGAPIGILGTRGDGPRRWLHELRQPAVVASGGGSAPAVVSGGEGVGELPRGEVKPAAGLIWFGVGRRKGLDQSRGSGHAGSGDDFCSGEIGRAGRSGSFTGMRRS